MFDVGISAESVNNVKHGGHDALTHSFKLFRGLWTSNINFPWYVRMPADDDDLFDRSLGKMVGILIFRPS